MATEGNGASRLKQLMTADTSKVSSVVMGVITSPLPNISVRLDGESIDTPTQGIVVAEHLADHTREISISGGTVSGAVQDTYSGGGSLKSIAVENATLTIKSNLKSGDRVI